MKKFNSFILGLIISIGIAYAQSSDRNSLGFFSVSGYPTCQMPLGYKTYCVVDADNVPIKTNTQVSRFYLSKLRKINVPEGADLVVKIEDVYESSSPVRIDDDRYERANRREQGPPPPPKFIGRATKEYGFKLTVFDNSDKVLYEDNYNKIFDIQSEWTGDPKIAKDRAIVKMKEMTFDKVMERYCPSVCKVLGTDNLASVRIFAYSVKVKKRCTIDYSDLNQAFTDFEAAFKIVDANDFDIDAFKIAAKPSMTTWVNALNESNLNDDDAKINKDITAAIYYNMATYYLLTKDFDIAEDYFKKSDLTDKGFGNASGMAQMVNTWQKVKMKYEKMMSGK